MKKILLCWFGFWLLLCPAQVKEGSSPDYHNIPQQVMDLMLEADLCALLDHCRVPALPEAGQRSFFTVPSTEEVETRLQRDTLLRHYIDRLRQLILVFHRLSVSENSPVTHLLTPGDSPDQFILKTTITPLASPLAFTISPDLDGERFVLSFTLNIHCSTTGWEITDLSRPFIYPCTYP